MGAGVSLKKGHLELKQLRPCSGRDAHARPPASEAQSWWLLLRSPGGMGTLRALSSLPPGLLNLEKLLRQFLISKETLSVRMLDDTRDPTPLLKEIRDDKTATIIIHANASLSRTILLKVCPAPCRVLPLAGVLLAMAPG